MAAVEIAARQLVVIREGRRVLDGASIVAHAQEIAVVEGPSGSGKSTLLRALAMLIEIDGGQLLLGGQDASVLPPRAYRTRVAYVPQLPPMFDGTVAFNLRAGPGLRGKTVERGVLEQLADRVGLATEYLDRDARSLSGGERQRVALARALANEPEVLLLDEPTSALDPERAERIIALVRTLAASGLTIVVVTHVAEQAAELGGQRLVCEAGRVFPMAAP